MSLVEVLPCAWWLGYEQCTPSNAKRRRLPSHPHLRPQADLVQLQELHDTEVRHLTLTLTERVDSRSATAARAASELERTSAALQTQLAAELDRADRLAAELSRLRGDKARKAADDGAALGRQVRQPAAGSG